jgi:hypothetical protein
MAEAALGACGLGPVSTKRRTSQARVNRARARAASLRRSLSLEVRGLAASLPPLGGAGARLLGRSPVFGSGSCCGELAVNSKGRLAPSLPSFLYSIG